MKTLEKAENEIKRLEAGLEQFKGFVSSYQDILLKLEHTTFSTMGDVAIFDSPPRDEALLIIKAIGGKWSKSKYGTHINYAHESGKVSLWNAEAPPACKIVMKTRVIPAKPEKIETYEELSCNLTEEQV